MKLSTNFPSLNLRVGARIWCLGRTKWERLFACLGPSVPLLRHWGNVPNSVLLAPGQACLLGGIEPSSAAHWLLQHHQWPLGLEITMHRFYLFDTNQDALL